jgi:hypothetical protein
VTTIDIYIDDDEPRRRRRAKWLIPLLIGVLVAMAVQREKPLPRAAVIPPARIIYVPIAVPTPPPTPHPPAPPPPPLPAHVVVTPLRMDFGDTPLAGTLPPKLATIRNDGGQPLAHVSAAVTGPFLAASGCDDELAPGEQCTIALVFAPAKPGRFDGNLNLAAGDQRTKVALHGSIRPDVVTPPPPPPPPPPPRRALCFDPPQLHFTSPGRQKVTITNPDETPLRVVAVTPIGARGQTLSGYEVNAAKCLRVLNAGERCTFAISASAVALQLRGTMQVAVY